ncbi:MAG: aminopeptidase [Aigarchaeota archaeon]|nr:aminopeptidase [Aigarchaeota archaeon]
MKPEEAAANALEAVFMATPGESLLVLADDDRLDVAEAFSEGGLKLSLWVRRLVLKTGRRHRTEPSTHLVEALTNSKPSIFVNILRGPAEEAPFRIRVIKLETRAGFSRLGHCPGIDTDMLTHGALALSLKEHRKMQRHGLRLIHLLEGSEEIQVTSPGGSDFQLSVKGRVFWTDTQFDWKTKQWLNLPTGEVIVGPVENSLNGVVVADVAVGGIGPLTQPVTIEASGGRAEKVKCSDAKVLRRVMQALNVDQMARYVGEWAIGLNPKARLVKEFLETEKLAGTTHVAFGHNLDYPGEVRNNSSNHMDFLISKPNVTAVYSDGEEGQIMRSGRLVL